MKIFLSIITFIIVVTVGITIDRAIVSLVIDILEPVKIEQVRKLLSGIMLLVTIIPILYVATILAALVQLLVPKKF